MALRKLLKNSIYIIVLRLNVVAKFMILIIKGLLRLDYIMKFTTGDTLWLEVSQYPELIAQFSSGNQTRIKQGLIAKAPLEGWHYGTKEIVKKFHIYHRVAIEYSGGIYDIDNLRRAHLICMMKFITGDS